MEEEKNLRLPLSKGTQDLYDTFSDLSYSKKCLQLTPVWTFSYIGLLRSEEDEEDEEDDIIEN